jgi:hypothetical protein
MNKFILPLILLLSSPIFGQVFEVDEADLYEHILAFHSDIRVLDDNSVQVTESITVYSEGNKIKRGIYRGLPISFFYEGKNRVIEYELLHVKRNGKAEPYHIKMDENDVRFYAGSSNASIPKGVHTYQFSYKLSNVIHSLKKSDELYWNVNGNGWEFDIDLISANVYYPENSTLLEFDGFVNRFGNESKSIMTEAIEGGISYVGTRKFNDHESLTIEVAWCKKTLKTPTKM